MLTKNSCIIIIQLTLSAYYFWFIRSQQDHFSQTLNNDQFSYVLHTSNIQTSSNLKIHTGIILQTCWLYIWIYCLWISWSTPYIPPKSNACYQISILLVFILAQKIMHKWCLLCARINTLLTVKCSLMPALNIIIILCEIFFEFLLLLPLFLLLLIWLSLLLLHCLFT